MHLPSVLLVLAAAATPSPSPAATDALVRRTCDALHGLPARRRAECCQASSASLADLCVETLAAAAGRGAVVLEPAAIDGCERATAAALEGCAWVTPLLPALPEACQAVVRGALVLGAACSSSLECLDGLYCRGLGPGHAGYCASPTAARTRCESPSDPLANVTRAAGGPHPVCDGLCIKGVCLPLAPVAGACQSSAQCQPGLNCIGGQCQARPLPTAGEGCSGGTACQAGSACVDGRCLALKAEGEACTQPLECRALECVKAEGAAKGRCGNPCAPHVPTTQ